MEVEEEDEENDIDFNPFLREDSPSEASSSLSSENEGGPGDAPLRPREGTLVCNDKENLMLATVIKKKETAFSIQQGADRVNTFDVVNNKDLSSRDETPRRSPVLEIDDDDEDAICKRTRARHSLANYTLEDLETFLQESDDDGEPPNVDDEEEYRKFLAAVLVGGTTDEKEGQANEILDEDEDNDADFELEIEEALESDEDENVDYSNRGKDGKQKGRDAHIPVTRQKKRLKESARNKNTLLGQAKKPLRPLMSYESSAQTPVFPAYGLGSSSPNVSPHCLSYASSASVITGFTAHQIGQLYVLIHEHVQLLIQVYSVSVLDPSKQQVASGVQKMISEMICRQEDALGKRKAPYPEFLFHRPNLRSSLAFDPHQAADSSDWTALIDNPVLSMLDVAPLRLVKSFMTDVFDTVCRHRRSHIDDESSQSHLIREPLFPLPVSKDSSDTEKDISAGATTLHSNTHSAVQASPAQVHKKSLASTLVEGTKKQSAALVPKDIARSAQRFYTLFNAALFPRKPPLPAVVNRVLFTDAEDGLLAMGIMRYNNDWATIQQHFLPCKSTHQIFVRQKNRSSSNAPENPIKAVRRKKSSPLTIDEKARICEGLKLFKNDWLSVWKLIVPYRDPSLLPRLWRIATGTQKSYRKSEAMREKRRLYEAKRRKMKALMDDCQTSSHKEGNRVDNGGDNGAGDVDGDNEAYVHEAFMADLEPRDAPSINRCDIQSLNIMPYNSSTSSEIFPHSSHQDFHPHASTGQLTYNAISRASNSQAPRSKGVKVVKLAPDLPPVNLPPSVRVISQSAFQNHRCGLLVSTFSDNAAKDRASRVLQTVCVGSRIFNLGEHLNKIFDNDLDARQQQDDNTHASQFGAEENTSESDLQMHPLLFQAPRDQLSPYFSSNSHATGSAIHNYLPRDLQPNPNLFRPQFSSGLCSNVTEQPPKASSDLPTIDFHPLLQRADSGNGDSSTRPSLYRKSGGSKTSQGIFSKLFNESDCNLRIPMLSNNQVATSTTSCIHNVKESNLDLDISLGSASDKEKALGRECHNVEGFPTLLEQRTVEKSLCDDSSLLNCSGRCPEATTTGNLSWHIFSPNNGGRIRCSGDHDSITGIVMEKEELSDSEEEIEHVEFEREVIEDSEDELVSLLPTGIQNKEFAFFTSKEEEIQAAQSLQSRHLKKGLVDKPKSDQPQQGRSSKKRTLELSKMHPLQASESKATTASRKPRKRSF